MGTDKTDLFLKDLIFEKRGGEISAHKKTKGYSMRFVVKITDRGLVNYIGNGSYRVNKERFAVLVSDEEQAKRYKTYNIAKNAYEKLTESCVNLEGDVDFVKVDETCSERYWC